MMPKIKNKKEQSSTIFLTKNRRGQLKIQQMAIMLLAVTLFFALAGMLILATQFSNLKQRATILEADNAKLLVAKIADSPEFSCGNSFGTGLVSCIDADKIINLKENMDKYENGNFWGVDGIEIRRIYPESNGTECTMLNYPDCDLITLIKSNGTGVSNFVSLCGKRNVNGKTYDKCELAKIIVTYQGA
jgi:hypothetical protein